MVRARYHRVIFGILPNVSITKKLSGFRFGENVLSCTSRLVEGQPCRKPQKQSGQGAVGIFKNSRRLGCVFRDVEPKFSSISRKSTTVLRPIHTVLFSKRNTQGHIKIRESKGPSLGVIQRTSPHERSPYAPKIEDRS